MISDKQRRILAFGYTDYDALICDGAVRSGKTSFITVSFVSWAMRCFDGRAFIIGGVSSGSARRNVIDQFMALAWAKRRFAMKWNGQDNCMTVSDGTSENRFYVFGGKDEASFRMVQGMTAAGCLLDECALMPRSFVEQCLARCSVEGSKFWFSCNPSGPEHWFYKEWILNAAAKRAYYMHFNLDDNPSLSESIRERYRSMYSGVFYRRYVLGEWVKAEGLVYDLPDGAFTPCEATGRDVCYISIDYGISNPFAALLWTVRDGVAYCVDEYYHDGRADGKRTDEEHYQAVCDLARGLFVDSVVIDPSATSFIELMRRRGVFDVRKANNDVLSGIMSVSSALSAGCLKFSPRCENMRKEFGLYSWDPKAKGDKVAKEHDHAADALRYFVQTIGRGLLSCFED